MTGGTSGMGGTSGSGGSKGSPAAPSLELFREGRPEAVFSSTGSWLHPLFDLERFLLSSQLDPRECVLRDKLVGKAAALLIVRLGFVRIYTGILSRPGEEVLTAHSVTYEAVQRVERILCRTEELLAEVDDPEEAYRIICTRIEERRVQS
ncbi:MAG: DUF1893 domain-containing protein [Spirochaetaceae bacterium]|nr:MAG: DUF1893 domain-containing protein [Spirochaetaceae bacterium]